MRRIIAFRPAAIVLLLLFITAFLFQLVVLAGYIPKEMVWGGKLESDEERTVMALVAIGVLLMMIAIVLIRIGCIGKSIASVGRYGMWAIVLLFALNTVGNLAAEDLRETLIFTPVTLVAALLAWRVALGE
jgi:archaellum biogenesis protein FlaJ (TadC family)